MTQKQLKKLRRPALLEILVAQNKENDALRAEIEVLKAQLEERQIRIAKAGSIAEAALLINDVFAKAQEAAGLYLENVRRQADAGEEVDLTSPESSEEGANEPARTLPDEEAEQDAAD